MSGSPDNLNQIDQPRIEDDRAGDDDSLGDPRRTLLRQFPGRGPVRKNHRPGIRPQGPDYDAQLLDGRGGTRNVNRGEGSDNQMDVGSPSSINIATVSEKWSRRRKPMPLPTMPNEKMQRGMDEAQGVHGPGSVDWQTQNDIQVR